jgi:hypothetical protein
MIVFFLSISIAVLGSAFSQNTYISTSASLHALPSERGGILFRLTLATGT